MLSIRCFPDEFQRRGRHTFARLTNALMPWASIEAVERSPHMPVLPLLKPGIYCIMRLESLLYRVAVLVRNLAFKGARDSYFVSRLADC